MSRGPARPHRRRVAALLVVLTVLVPFRGTRAEDDDPAAEEGEGVVARYDDGLEVETRDGTFRLHAELRVQLRFTTPFDDDPRTPEDFARPDATDLALNRGRVKLGGHAYRPWLGYYLEYDLPSDRLLDLRVTLSRFEWLQLRVGQGKAIYNRERVASSGRQQFVERSIVNREFTIDRQQGVQLLGRLLPGTAADSRYWLGVFSGAGRGESNDDDRLMWMGRYQWNFLGRDLPFSQSDVERHESPAGSLALAAVTNRGASTRFSSDGGGQLDGFPDGAPGQYDVDQWLAELAFKWRGVSFLHEYHEKRVADRLDGSVTRLAGGFVQAGYFPHEAWAAVPAPLEVAARRAVVDPDRAAPGDRRHETTFAVNWFFAGHRNKLTLDVSRLDLAVAGAETLRDDRLRVQWDLSF